MKAIVPILANEMRYEVPPQDLTIDLNLLPALPRSRFVITGVGI